MYHRRRLERMEKRHRIASTHRHRAHQAVPYPVRIRVLTTDQKGSPMPYLYIPQCRSLIVNYLNNAGYEVQEGESLDQAAWELSDLAHEKNYTSIYDISPDELNEIIIRNDL